MKEKETFSAILENRHFSQFAALLAVPFRSYRWRQTHSKVPFWTLWRRCTDLLSDASFAQQQSRDEFLIAFTELVTVVQADPHLFYRKEDMDWLIQVMDGKYALTTMSMLFAFASSKDRYVTPVQVAAATGTAESSWRNRCARGEIVGAFKAGKQWLISATALRAYGIEIEIEPVGDEDVENAEDNVEVGDEE